MPVVGPEESKERRVVIRGPKGEFYSIRPQDFDGPKVLPPAPPETDPAKWRSYKDAGWVLVGHFEDGAVYTPEPEPDPEPVPAHHARASRAKKDND